MSNACEWLEDNHYEQRGDWDDFLGSERKFALTNLENRDLSLETSFLWQDKNVLSLNPSKIAIGSTYFSFTYNEGDVNQLANYMTADLVNKGPIIKVANRAESLCLWSLYTSRGYIATAAESNQSQDSIIGLIKNLTHLDRLCAQKL